MNFTELDEYGYPPMNFHEMNLDSYETNFEGMHLADKDDSGFPLLDFNEMNLDDWDAAVVEWDDSGFPPLDFNEIYFDQLWEVVAAAEPNGLFLTAPPPDWEMEEMLQIIQNILLDTTPV